MQITQNQEIQLHQGLLLFKPQKQICNYGFVLNYEQAKLKISFELQLTFLGIKNQNFASYSMDRKSIFLNNQKPDSMLYEIANKMSEGLYPIEFTINQNLECVSINNHKAIMARCEEIEQEITNYYQGEIPQKMIANFQDSYKNPSNLLKQIQKEMWFQLLFFPMFNAYNALLQSKINYKWFVEAQQIEFELQNHIEKFYDHNGKVVVHVVSKDSLVNQASYQATFCLHSKSHTIATINGTVAYQEEGKTETLRFECYDLNG